MEIRRTVLVGATLVLVAVLVACATAEPDQSPAEGATLSGTEWALTSLIGQALIEDTRITLGFGEGSLEGSAGCNTYGGSYTVTDDSLRLSDLYWTEMGCLEPEGILDQETAYLNALNTVASYRVDAGRLELYDEAGTQILAKGLHFPNVTLVGVVSADTCLYLPDFRSNERTFQLISQVAGRAGRSEKRGIVFVQTYFSEQPAVKAALAQDFEGFVREELKHRKACDLPPYWRLASVVLRDPKHDKLETAANAMRQRIDGIVRQQRLNVKVRGPMPAVISRIEAVSTSTCFNSTSGFSAPTLVAICRHKRDDSSTLALSTEVTFFLRPFANLKANSTTRLTS